MAASDGFEDFTSSVTSLLAATEDGIEGLYSPTVPDSAFLVSLEFAARV